MTMKIPRGNTILLFCAELNIFKGRLRIHSFDLSNPLVRQAGEVPVYPENKGSERVPCPKSACELELGSPDSYYIFV